MKRFLTLIFAHLLGATTTWAVSFTSAPSQVSSGTPYTISAQEYGNDAGVELILYRDGSMVDYGSAWGWSSVSASHSTTDYGVQSHTYEAVSSFYDYEGYYQGGDYASHTVSIIVPNQAPTITWAQNPSWVPIGQLYTVQAHGHDDDGNLFGVSVYRDSVPFALNGGQNTYDVYSDPNWAVSYGIGQVSFDAQAFDNSGAVSEIIHHIVNIYDTTAPTIAWVNTPTASVWINQHFVVQAKGHDDTHNLAYVRVWKGEEPFAFNGGGDGTDAYSDNNVAWGTTRQTMTFKALAIDSAGLDSGFISVTTYVDNRPPTMSPVEISGPTVQWNSQYAHYYMWAGGGEQAGGGQLTMSSTVEDEDCNLQKHILEYRHVTNDPLTWHQLGDDAVSATTNPKIYKKSYAMTNMETPGQWDFHAYCYDGVISPESVSKTVWVYGNTNAATFVSQKINATVLNTSGALIELESGSDPLVAKTATAEILMRNTGTKPWRNHDNIPGVANTPHVLSAIGSTPTVWGTTEQPLSPSDANVSIEPGIFSGANDTAIFAFTFTVPRRPTVGNEYYTFQWKMREKGIAGNEYFESATPEIHIKVKDTTPPTAPSNLSASNLGTTSFRLNWTASVENGQTLNYDVYKTINGVTTLVGVNITATSLDIPGLASGFTYTMKVVAKDGVGLVTESQTFDVTTIFDPDADNDGDGVSNGVELLLGLKPNDPNDVKVFNYTYDKANQLKAGPGGEYVKDAEGNIKKVQ